MNILYLDTNIFVYISNPKSPFYQACWDFIVYCQHNNIWLFTSVETIQEICHLYTRIDKIKHGKQIAKHCIELIEDLLSVDKETIYISLQIIMNNLDIYSTRDLLHTAVCLQNHIPTIISYDSDFTKIKGVKAYTPEQYLKKH